MKWKRVYFAFPGCEAHFCHDFESVDRLWLFVAALYEAAEEIFVSTDSKPFATAGEVRPPRPDLNEGIFVERVKRFTPAKKGLLDANTGPSSDRAKKLQPRD